MDENRKNRIDEIVKQEIDGLRYSGSRHTILSSADLCKRYKKIDEDSFTAVEFADIVQKGYQMGIENLARTISSAISRTEANSVEEIEYIYRGIAFGTKYNRE